MKKLLICAVFTALLGGSGAGLAAPVRHAPVMTAASCAINAAQASRLAQKRYGGKVIDVKVINLKGQRAYRVKLLQKNGRIHSVVIDAASGRPLR